MTAPQPTDNTNTSEQTTTTNDSPIDIVNNFKETFKNKYLELLTACKDMAKETETMLKSLLQTVKKTTKKGKNKKSQRNSENGFQSPTDVPEKVLHFVNNGKIEFKDDNAKLFRVTGDNRVQLVEKDSHGHVHLDQDTKYPRTLITHLIHEYAKQKGLKGMPDPNDATKINKKYFKVDAALTSLFELDENSDALTFDNFQTYLSKLYPKKEKPVAVAQTTEEAPAPAPKPPAKATGKAANKSVAGRLPAGEAGGGAAASAPAAPAAAPTGKKAGGKK